MTEGFSVDGLDEEEAKDKRYHLVLARYLLATSILWVRALKNDQVHTEGLCRPERPL